jgi:hypothetical protein
MKNRGGGIIDRYKFCILYSEIRTIKQRTYVGKYSFVNRTIKSWNQLSAGLLASFPCKMNTFRKRVKNVVTAK